MASSGSNVVTATISNETLLNNTTNMADPNESSTIFYACGTTEDCLWTVFSPIIFFVGIFGNSLNVYVLHRLKFHQNTTLCLLFVLAFADMTVLCVGPTRYWIRSTFDVDIRSLSNFSCKFHLFLIYFSMHMSSWILVQVTFVRFVKTVLLDNRYRKAQRLVNMRNSLITLVVMTITLTALDCHYFFTNGIVDGDCDSLTDEIFQFEEFVFTYIDLVVLAIVPGVAMLILNLCIIRQIRKIKYNHRLSVASDGSDKGAKGSTKQQPISKMTRMLICTSFYFIIATTPICIYFIVDSYLRPGSSAAVEKKLDLTNAVVYLFQFTHFAINFYFYTATNKRFRNELGKIGVNAKKIFFHSVNTSEPTSDLSSAEAYHLRKPSRSASRDS